MVSLNAARTKTGLTLLQSEQRIDALEIAAAKAVLLIANALKHEVDVEKHGQILLSCVDLLFDELKLEGMAHNAYVVNSLSRTKAAVSELRQSMVAQRRHTP
jgi:hypothetical protein